MASRNEGLEFLLEVIPSKIGPVSDTTTAQVIQRFFAAGVYPDWWKLEPQKTHKAWKTVCEAISNNDPYTRGIVVLGLDAPVDALKASFSIAAKHDLVKGFAVGRTLFGATARAWMSDDISDGEAVGQMAAKYAALCDIWDETRRKAAKNE